ncbi:MAG: TraR/DksA C4-type zinc finger protein [Salinivirgaceae bacterium]|jgi:DnaK suppressor protein|nr:TraR/DksA C4-type zinc finger protein [Salinivirgaceae bacterium]
MDKKQNAEIKELIETEILKTKNSIADYKDMTIPEGLDDAVGRVSRMDAINNKSITQAALRQAEEKLKKLEYVLSQIHKDGFGECARCGKIIPIGRIILMPQSIYCVRCAQ